MQGQQETDGDACEVRTAGNFRWKLSAGWDEVLLDDQGGMLAQWQKLGQAQVVKHGQHRTVYRIDLPGKTVYWKHYRCSHWLTLGKHAVRHSPSYREWQRAQEIHARGIPTITPVAFAEQRRHGLVHDSYFITEGIADTQPLDHFALVTLPTLPSAERDHLRKQLLDGLGRMCAEIHRAGVHHNDFHAGNVLVQQCGDKLPLYLIDVPGVSFSGPMNWSASCHSLAMFASGLLGSTTWRDRWRVWRAYRKHRPDLDWSKPKQKAEQVERLSQTLAMRIIRGRDKRAWSTNKDFYRIASRQYLGFATRSVSPELMKKLLENPHQPSHQGRHEPVKISHSSLVVKTTLPIDGQPLAVAYKRSRPKTWLKAVAAWLQPRRLLRGWHVGHALLSRGIATPRPLLAAVSRRGQAGFVATEWLTDALDLHLYAWQLAELPADQRDARVRQTAESLGRLLGRMHAWHVSHRDLKANNLMARETPTGLETFLIDLDGVCLTRHLSPRDWMHDLSRLAASLRRYPWISRTNLLRFLQAYLSQHPAPVPIWQTLWRGIQQHTQGRKSVW